MAIKKINTDLQIEAGLLDGDGNSGSSNQILISTGTGIDWVDGSGSGIIGGPYLPLSGGTVTGTLTVTDSTTGIHVDSAGHSSVRLDRGSTSFDNNLLFNTAGVLDFRIWQDGSSDYLFIRDETGGAGNMVTFKKGGNVGIGTTDPGAKLHIISPNTSSFNQVIKLSGQVGVGGGQAVFFKTSGADDDNRYGVKLGAVRSDSDNGSSVFKIQQELDNGSGTLIGLTDTFTINQYGNVGIGATDPGTKLDVSGDIRGYGNIQINSAATGNPYLAFQQDSDQKAVIQYKDDTDVLDIQTDGGFRFLSGTSNVSIRIDTSGNLTTAADNHITFGPNTTWGSSLRVGGNGRTATGTEMASVVTTDGNLHLDAADDANAIYLNYYAGTSGVMFGNGADGIVARMDAVGNLYKATSTSNVTATYWHSGNDGPTSGLAAQTAATASYVAGADVDGAVASATNADTVDGVHASYTRNLANTIPVRDGNGYLNLGWINTTSGNTTNTLTDVYVNTNDGYIRKATPAHFRSQITDGAYVNTTGDTMTGTLTFNNSTNTKINLNDSNAYWLATATNWGLYWNTSNNQLQFHGAGNTRGYIDLDNGRLGISEHLLAGGNVYSSGNEGFVFGSSTGDGEYIKRSGNDIQFFAGGSVRMTVDGDVGSVGIGTTSPSSELHVSGTGTVARLQSDSTYVDLLLSSNLNSGFLNLDNDKMNFYVGGGSSGDLKMSILNNGNVGIGTTSPSSKLEVYGSGGTILDIQGSQGQLFSVTDDLTGTLFTVSDISGIPIFEVDASGVSSFDGNVGIGKTSPDSILHLKGDTPEVRVESTVTSYNTLSSKIGFYGGNDSNLELASIRVKELSSGGIGGGLGIFTTRDPNTPQENVTITSYGDVGIGTTNPNAQLEVSNDNFSFVNVVTPNIGPGTGGYLRMGTSGGTSIIDSNVDLRAAIGSCFDVIYIGSTANISIGQSHSNYSYDSTIGGGRGNTIATNSSNNFIGGGGSNVLSSNEGFIGGGNSNSVSSGCKSSIAGGFANSIDTICGEANTIGGGRFNVIFATNKSANVISGGQENTLDSFAESSVIGGGFQNYVQTYNSTIGGGAYNCINNNSWDSTIAGGNSNKIVQSCCSFIGGGRSNCICSTSNNSVIAGGFSNHIYNSACFSGILGGCNSTVCHYKSFVVGSDLVSTTSCYTFVRNLCSFGALTSDSRLKENINNLPYGLQEIKQLDPVSYNFIDDDSKKVKYGFLAQCVQEIMPDIVTEHPLDTIDNTPVLQFDKEAVWSSLINAIKEQQQQIDSLEQRIDTLENQ